MFGKASISPKDDEPNITSAPSPGVSDKSLKYLSIEARCIYFVIFTIILLVAVIGNILAIKATIERKHRIIQKSLIISLALSDMLIASVYAINHLETFSHPLVNWTMGSFMCGFIPLAQICSVVVSSALLVGIAIDRYNNVMNAINKRWDPSLSICISAIVTLWITSIFLSSPMLLFFEIKRVNVLFLDETGKIPLYVEKQEFCLADSQAMSYLMIYYTCIMIIIFLPMLLVFIWLYWNIAHLVWIHRKPVFGRFKQNSESSTTAETASTQLKSMQSTQTTNIIRNSKPNDKIKRSIHVERKIRTFKIIVFIMFVFMICRLPYWILNVIKVSTVMTEEYQWLIVYTTNAFNILNSALNPFIYTFLNPTLKTLKRIGKSVGDFVSQICCCCCVNEFEQFENDGERSKNPFMLDLNKKHEEKTKMKRNFKGKVDNDAKERY